MENKNPNDPVTRVEFFRETQSIREVLKEEVGSLRIEIKSDISRVLNAIDTIAQRVETYYRKVLVHDHRLNEHQELLKLLSEHCPQ